MKAVVLLSGGQDSAACLSLAFATHGRDAILALSIFYGQRHATEIEAAAAVAEVYGVDHVVIELPAFGALTSSVSDLTKPAGDIAAEGGFADAEMPQGLPTSFVPGRNALLLTLAASVAVSRGASEIWSGVCQTDFSGYPDCRLIFVEAMQQALTLAMPSSNPIRIVTPLMHLTKA
jgi:7-cyano-7-deazaguanine synthase